MTKADIRSQAQPNYPPALDAEFIPAALYHRAFCEEIQHSGKCQDLVFGLERADGSLSRFETQVFTRPHPWAEYNNEYSERILKFLLWQRGGWRVYIGGPADIADHLRRCYAPGGERGFDQLHALSQFPRHFQRLRKLRRIFAARLRHRRRAAAPAACRLCRLANPIAGLEAFGDQIIADCGDEGHFLPIARRQ
jgi:hypothetical protein